MCIVLHVYLLVLAGTVTIVPTEGGTTYVNGTQIFEPTKLVTGSRIILGNNHVFRYNNPEEGIYSEAVPKHMNRNAKIQLQQSSILYIPIFFVDTHYHVHFILC